FSTKAAELVLISPARNKRPASGLWFTFSRSIRNRARAFRCPGIKYPSVRKSDRDELGETSSRFPHMWFSAAVTRHHIVKGKTTVRQRDPARDPATAQPLDIGNGKSLGFSYRVRALLSMDV